MDSKNIMKIEINNRLNNPEWDVLIAKKILKKIFYDSFKISCLWPIAASFILILSVSLYIYFNNCVSSFSYKLNVENYFYSDIATDLTFIFK
ncbi:MAG TPA: hypothetical protein PKY81_00020 [bacterium]|nr:hypothetical protein [bacterium]HPN29318.1 hypothetical protein [bacterium]